MVKIRTLIIFLVQPAAGSTREIEVYLMIKDTKYLPPTFHRISVIAMHASNTKFLIIKLI